MNNYLTIVKGLFKNKLRFDADKKKSKKIALLLLFGLTYALLMAVIISVVVECKELFTTFPFMAQMFYIFVLLTSSVIVLFFGIIHLISVLYLSKDTDFYSMLPVKPATVFSAKLTYVYLSETVIVEAIALPILIAFGIVSNMWAWFYVISIATLLIVPILPLVVAAIVAVPLMLFAGKLKNRNVVTLIFSLVLFGGLFALYIYFVFLSSSGTITPEGMQTMLDALQTVLYVFYPYTVLSASACGLPLYGLGLGASTAVGLAIFLAISAALLVVICVLAKYMYAQSVKANNQTDSSKAKKGEFKSASATRSLIKREYISSIRTTQIAFQCYAVMLLPIIMSVFFGVLSRNPMISDGGETFNMFVCLLSSCTLCAMFAALGNGAFTTFSREGDALATLKNLPVSIKTIFKAKVSAWLFLAVPVAIITVAISSALNFSWQTILLQFFSLVPIAIVFVIFGALWDLSAPKLKWTDPMQAIKHNMHVLGGQMLTMAGGLAIMVLTMVLVSCGVSMAVTSIVCWAMLFAIFAVFAVVDIILYRRINVYYDRIEM